MNGFIDPTLIPALTMRCLAKRNQLPKEGFQKWTIWICVYHLLTASSSPSLSLCHSHSSSVGSTAPDAISRLWTNKRYIKMTSFEEQKNMSPAKEITRLEWAQPAICSGGLNLALLWWPPYRPAQTLTVNSRAGESVKYSNRNFQHMYTVLLKISV